MTRSGSKWPAAAAMSALLGVAGCGSGSTGSNAARPAPSVTASRSASPSPGAKHYVPQPLPKRSVAFRASWISPAVGWLAASEPCGESLCVALYATRDAGRDWSRVAVPPMRLVQPAGVVFVDARTGYLFSGQLLMTRDGGRHWARQPVRNVSDVLPEGTSVLALTYDHGGCPGPCDVRVERAPIGSGSWTTSPLAALGAAGYTSLAGAAGGVVAIASGDRASASAKGALAISADSGAHWTGEGDPCGERRHREYDLIDAAADGATVAVLCGAHIGTERDFVITSTDGGHRFGSPDWLPGAAFGHLVELSNGQLLAATGGRTGNGHTTYLIASANRSSSWRQVLAADEPVYDQPEELAGHSGLDVSARGVLTYVADGVHAWRSDDAGQTWKPLPLP
jgi:hypothetical protein